jgi:hypothetical protein
MNDRMFARLKPERLDELADATYWRRRETDLARAFHTPREARSSRRFSMSRPKLLAVAVAGTAAALAAAAIVVPRLAGGAEPGTAPAGPSVVAVNPPASAESSGGTVDGRSFLLAAAESLAAEPATSGRFWYTRERTWQIIENQDEYQSTLKALIADLRAKEKELKDRPEELKAAREEIEKKIVTLKSSKQPYTKLPYKVFNVDTREQWRAREKGVRSRSVSNKDTKLEFGSPSDEAKWKEAGSPPLVEQKEQVTEEDMGYRVLSISNPSLTVQNVPQLPTDQDALKRRLKQLFAQRPSGGAEETFASYLWQTGADLLAGPITPGTRAALFRVLADQPELKAQGEVTDSTGRKGVSLETKGPDDAGVPDRITYRMIVDAKTGELLEYEVIEGRTSLLLRVVFEDMGWVDRLGTRPQS